MAKCHDLQCLLLVSDVKIGMCQGILVKKKTPNYEISGKSLRRASSCSIRTEGWSEITRLTVVLRNCFAHAPTYNVKSTLCLGQRMRTVLPDWAKWARVPHILLLWDGVHILFPKLIATNVILKAYEKSK
jgi:hypothetical protein